MDNEQLNASAPPSDSGAAVRRGTTRRRLISGAIGGSGVLLAVQAKTALGQTVCQSPSAMISGNTSAHPNSTPCSGGRSPGFWKVPQHFGSWQGAIPATFTVTVDVCATGLQGLKITDIATQGTPVTTILPGASLPPPLTLGGYWGIWAVLAFPTDFGASGQLMRHLISAWLNAAPGLFTAPYPITRAQVTDMWVQLNTAGSYCPSGMTCGANAMSPTDVINYITGMYDFNGDLVEPDLCKK